MDLSFDRRRRRTEDSRFDFTGNWSPLHVQLQSAQSLVRRSPSKVAPLCISPAQGIVHSVKSATRGISTKSRPSHLSFKEKQIIDGKFVPALSVNFHATAPLKIKLPVVKIESKAAASTIKTLQTARLRRRETQEHTKSFTLRTRSTEHRKAALFGPWKLADSNASIELAKD